MHGHMAETQAIDRVESPHRSFGSEALRSSKFKVLSSKYLVLGTLYLALLRVSDRDAKPIMFYLNVLSMFYWRYAAQYADLGKTGFLDRYGYTRSYGGQKLTIIRYVGNAGFHVFKLLKNNDIFLQLMPELQGRKFYSQLWFLGHTVPVGGGEWGKGLGAWGNGLGARSGENYCRLW